jgi:hypothetical protein
MRRALLLAAVVAMVLAAAAPAFAQASAVGGSVQYVDCDQIQAAVTGQYNVANQQDLAAVAQSLNVSQNQVSACLGSIAAGDDVNIGGGPKVAAPKVAVPKVAAPKVAAPKVAVHADTATPTATASPTATATAPAPAGAPAELPPTGGTQILALGAAVLLVAGGLLARRIVR